MADLKISQLTGATTPLAGTEVLPIVQSGSTKKVATDDLTVKNIRSNATTGLVQIAGPSAGQTRVVTVPDANSTMARTDAGQSFTGTQVFQNINTGSGIVNGATSGVASTLFSASGDGLYFVTAYLINDAAAYIATAIVASSGAAYVITPTNAMLMTLTMSGANVQATQASGAAQNIYFSYLKIK